MHMAADRLTPIPEDLVPPSGPSTGTAGTQCTNWLNTQKHKIENKNGKISSYSFVGHCDGVL